MCYVYFEYFVILKDKPYKKVDCHLKKEKKKEESDWGATSSNLNAIDSPINLCQI